MNEIILLQQIEDIATLYANCIKNGYNVLHYFSDPEHVHILKIETPEIVIKNLLPGDYHLYATNESGEEVGHLSFTVSGLKKETVFQNILTCVGIKEEIDFSSIPADNYIPAMYDLYIKEKISEETLQAFIVFYNTTQNELNTTSIPEFVIKQNSEIYIDGKFHIPYTFIPYRYNFGMQNQIMLREQAIFNEENYWFIGKPRNLYQICVLNDFSLVRRYYHYQLSETASETILERHIQTIQTKTEQTKELITQLNLESIAEDRVGQETVIAIQKMNPARPIFSAPEVEIHDSVIFVSVPDYTGIRLTEKNIYLAALEMNEVFSDKHSPHKYKVNADSFQLKASMLLINSDTEYVFYLTDDNNIVLSNVVLASFDPDFKTSIYTDAYLRIVYDTYVRRLSSIFKEYDRNSWNLIAQLLDQYLLTRDGQELPSSFLQRQILQLDANRYRIDKLFELTVLCQLKYYMPVQQNFISHQVFSKEFKSHIFPEAEQSYIVRISHINGNTITEEFLTAGSESLSVRIDKDDFVLLQCIDPEKWCVSSPVFYNNRIKTGAPYFYFPKMEVEVI